MHNYVIDVKGLCGGNVESVISFWFDGDSERTIMLDIRNFGLK
jgi:hypothetical protein